jgi:hypothetical protein
MECTVARTIQIRHARVSIPGPKGESGNDQTHVPSRQSKDDSTAGDDRLVRRRRWRHGQPSVPLSPFEIARLT